MKKLQPMLLVIAALFATLHWNDAKAGTLCQDYGGVCFYRTVGAGTAYLKSSDLGGSSANYNIYISGDFEIDNNFTFLNNVIKIAPGIKITVKANYKTLTLDNTKLFACSQRWKGITLEYAAIITTKNNTRIEDADAAITMSQSGYYTIQNTTFDRNYVGMDFVSSGSGSISNNVNFTCNSALNGGGTSFAGIKLANYSLSVGTLANPYVIFNGLQYGIYATSSSSPVSIIGRSLKFENIATNAIYIQKGFIRLRKLFFL